MRTQESSEKDKIEKGKEEESRNEIQKESRTNENTIKQKKKQYKQDESPNKENTERQRYKQKQRKQTTIRITARKTTKKEKRRKRERRSKKINNTLKDFKVFYQNVLYAQQKEEEIGIPEHRIYRNDGTKNSKGILIAVRNSTKTISVEVTRYDKVGQTLGILLNNQKQKIGIGVIYGPQVNMTQNNELKLLHKTIAEQTEIIKEKYQQVLM